MLNLGVLKSLAGAQKYLRGNVIVRESVASEMYIVLKGDVGLFTSYRRPHEEMVFTVGAGDYFGEMTLFADKNMPYTAVALTEVIALAVDRNTVAAFIKDEPEMALELMKAVCTRLDHVSAAYEKLSGSAWVESGHVMNGSPDQAEQPVEELFKAEPETALIPPASPEAAQVEDPVQNPGFSLFPEGHGAYRLPMNNTDQVLLMDKNYSCPICGGKFTSLKVMNSKLMLENTDSDMRNRYRGIEPLYYDLVTCPHCLYSALSEMFGKPDKTKAEVQQALQAIQSEIHIKSGTAMDTFSVFAGYYLALFCAPKCFAMPHLATAKLLLKLSRIYQDCGDTQMEEITAKRALDAYMYVYEHVEIPPNQDQQLCVVIGELSLKVKDFKTAQDFFFKANNSTVSTPLLKNHAQNRIFDIREMAGKS